MDVCAKMAKPIEMPFGFWTRMARRNCVRWDSRGAEGRCHGNQFWDAVCYNWLSMGYNFGCMVTSNTLFHSTGGFSGSSYPLKTADFKVLKDIAMATIFWLSVYWVHIGATWQIRLNRPCAVAIWPYVKLL